MTELLSGREERAGVDDGRRPALLALGATLLCLVLVSVRLGDKSFWHDEGFSVGLVDRPFGDALWRMAHWEVNQSPFFLLLTGWWRLGQSETFLRLLPAGFAVLAVPAVYDLGRRLAGPRVGAVASLLLAVHPLVLEWGQQVRAYSLTLLLTIVATTLLLRALDAPESTGRALAYAAVAAIATYSHFYAGLVIASHGLWLLLQRPRPRRVITVAGVAYVALVSPLVEFLLSREGDPLQWVGEAGTRSAVVNTAKGLTGGSWWSVATYAGAVAAGLWAVGVRPRGMLDLRRPGALAAMWLVVPVIVVTVSTLTVKPLLEARFLIVIVPALVVLAAAGIGRLPPAAGATLLALLVVVSAVGIERWYSAPSNEDWRTATVLVARSAGGSGNVVVFPFGGSFALDYYEDRLGVEVPMFISPPTDGPPFADPLVEVRGRSTRGREARVPPGYEAWRDRHYALRDEAFARGIAVRTYVQD